MKKCLAFILLMCPALLAFSQSDLVVGTSYQLNLQRQGNNGTSFILHNAKVDGAETFLWQATHGSFGSRGIAMRYTDGITFYADNAVTTANGAFTPTPRFFIGNNGNVGIGTSTPQKTLDVVSGINNYVSFGQQMAAGNYSGIHFGYLETNNTLYRKSALVFERVDGSARGKVHFLNNGNNDSGSATLSDSKMTLDFNGNVGIGTTAPGGKLHIDGSTYVGNENGDALYRVSIGSSGGNYGSVGYGYKYTTTSAHTYAVGDYASQLSFDAGGFSFKTAPIGTAGASVAFTDAMKILQNGNVGIGTASPQALLHVAGTSFLGSTGSEFYVSSGTTFFGTKAGIRNNGGDVVFNSKDGGTVYLNRDVASDVRIQSFNSATSTRTDIATFLQNGNVGIGTTNPGSYKLAVEGKIGAREVNVIATNPWPDYVFEKNYKLPSLEEIKNYIDQNQHLPEVPSAKEVEKSGVNLGEMNALLLKKIEELTLHLIEQNKMIAELKGRSVSPDPSGKKIEELTLHLIELKSENQQLKSRVEKLEK